MAGERRVKQYISDKRSTYLLLFILVGVFLVGFAIRNPIYQFGVSDHNEQLIVVHRFLDSSFLESDYILNQKTAPDSPRYIFGLFVSLFASVIGIETTYLLLHIVFMGIMIWATFTLSSQLFDDWVVGVAIIGLFFLPITGDISLGGNSLVSKQFNPARITNALVLAAFVYLLRDRHYVGFTLLGAGSIIHASIGLWMSGVAVLAVTAREYVRLNSSLALSERAREMVRELPWRPFGLYALIVAVGLSKIIVSNLTASVTADTVWILAFFRHPHHYIPSTWPTSEIVEYLGLVGAAAAVYGVSQIADVELFESRESEAFGLVFLVTPLLIMGIGGYLLTEVVRVDFIVKLQPFHIDYFPKILLFGVLASGVREAINRTVSPPAAKNVSLAVLVVVSIALIGGHVSVHSVDNRTIVTSSYGGEQETYNWIRANTPEESVLITPPSIQTARLGADRAIVGDYKTFVFTPEGMAEWKKRLDMLCGADLESFSQCQYDELTADEVVDISETYDACYMMARSETSYDQFELVHEDSHYKVYHVAPSAACGE